MFIKKITDGVHETPKYLSEASVSFQSIISRKVNSSSTIVNAFISDGNLRLKRKYTLTDPGDVLLNITGAYNWNSDLIDLISNLYFYSISYAKSRP